MSAPQQNGPAVPPDPPPFPEGARRVVVKVGSALLADGRGAVRRAWLNALADDIAALKARGVETLVVSSGAIAIGRRRLGLPAGRPLRLEEKQAAAAAGQIQLAHAYQDALGRHDLMVAQILLTPADTEERRRHLNARDTLAQLLKLGATPVINENDTVATDEIRYGDNDRLAARVAAMAGADTLILLSDIDGLYETDPKTNPAARHIPHVRGLSDDILRMAGDAPPGFSSGGMKTKLAAARIALNGGCRMCIAPGAAAHPLQRLAEGGRCTWFHPSLHPPAARKRWIAGMLKTAGVIVVDAGAEVALRAGRSLLPVGAAQVTGAFRRGDPVLVRAADGRRLGVGLAACSSQRAMAVRGLKSADIAADPAYGEDEGRRTVLIHRDDLALDPAETAGNASVADHAPAAQTKGALRT